jgi:drug/metabolite transporter (DMT)-like permease
MMNETGTARDVNVQGQCLPVPPRTPAWRMLFALLAAFLFACSGVCAQRTSSMLGPIKANTLRLGFSCLVLGLWVALTGGVDFGSEAARRLYFSGVAGFGLGDMALFFALPRLGARLTLLINLCTAPLFGLAGDWLLLGTRLELLHGLCCVVILVGVSQALLAKRTSAVVHAGSRLVGGIAALVAGFGQGTGATLSRWAHVAEHASGSMLPSHAETFLRVVPGFAVVALLWLVMRVVGRRGRGLPAWAQDRGTTVPALAWMVANATAGAILGVTCFQRALIDVSSAVALSITATTPVLVMPITAYSEGDVPSARSWSGAVIAVVGVVALKLGVR